MELLVVIAIIAVLASILLPTLSKARSKARTQLCLNNLKQQVLACHMYADDEDGWLPYNPRYGVYWQILTTKYVAAEPKSWGSSPNQPNRSNSPHQRFAVFRCPETEKWPTDSYYPRGTYGYNMFVTTFIPNNTEDPKYRRRPDGMRYPERMLLIGDCNIITPTGWGTFTQSATPVLGGPTGLTRYHPGLFLNMVFVDGSGKALRRGEDRTLLLGDNGDQDMIRGWY